MTALVPEILVVVAGSAVALAVFLHVIVPRILRSEERQ